MAALTKYKDHMPAKLVELASEGRSMVQIAKEFGIDKNTIYAWKDDVTKPEFMEAYRLGNTCFEAYWEEVGQKGAKGVLAKFCYPAWDRIIRARCRDEWSDSAIQRMELKNEVGKLTNKEIDEAIKALIAARQNNKPTEPGSGSNGSEALV